MAGDWIKFEVSTPEKQEVLAITATMGWDDPDLTVGKLLRVWRWFDQQTVDGNAPGVTSALLDRIVGSPGFSEAMESVGWLLVSDHGLSLPNFGRHNGKTAKERALTAKRVAAHKTNASGNGPDNGSGNAVTVTSSLPREEKNKEDIKKTQPLPFPAVRETLERCARTASTEDATAFHDGFMQALRREGWTLTAEHEVEDRGDGRRGRIDVLVTSPVVVGIELDRCSVREKSTFKLGQIDGYRVAILREVANHEDVAGLDAVICCGTKPKRERKARVSLKTFVAKCTEAGEKPISEYRPLQEYVEATGLPWEFVQITWDVFKREFLPPGQHAHRLQADWRRHFLNYVEKGYYRLWFAKQGETGPVYELTTQGIQAQASLREAA